MLDLSFPFIHQSCPFCQGEYTLESIASVVLKNQCIKCDYIVRVYNLYLKSGNCGISYKGVYIAQEPGGLIVYPTNHISASFKIPMQLIELQFIEQMKKLGALC